MAEDLRQRTARGFAWGLVNQGSMQVLNLAFGIVLARLLSPADYGIVGVLAVFSMIALNLQSCGFAQGLINLRQAEHRDYNSVFWFNVGVSAAIYAVLFVCAPIIADFFHEPRLVWVSRLVFLGFLISSTGIVHGAYMTKHLMVKHDAIISTVALLCSGTTGIALAYTGYSYWSLAWQQVVFISISMAGRYLVVPFRPSFCISMQPVRRMFRFSVNIMITSLVSSLSKHLLTFIFGRMLPMDSVGNYSQANKWSVTASETIRGAVGGIAQPVLKEVANDRERTLRVLRKMVRITSLVSFPALFGLAIVSREFILVTIGEKWLSSAALLAPLAVGGSVVPLYSLLQNVLISHGLSDRYLRINVVQVALQLIIALACIPWGMLHVVVAMAAYNMVYLLVWHRSVQSLTGYTLGALAADLFPFVATSSVAVAAAWYVTALCPSVEESAWLTLAVRIVTASATYLGILGITKSNELHEAIAFVRHKHSDI